MKVTKTVRAALGLLDRRDRRLLGLSVLLQMVTSVLDLIGVMLIGLVGALAVSTVGGQPPPKRVMSIINGLGFGGMSDNARIALFACVAAVLLLAKSLISPVIASRALNFLASREAVISGRLTRELLSRPLIFVQKRSSQETAGALLQGVNAATIGVLGQMVIGVSEIALLVVLSVVLLLVNPFVALGAIAFFLLVGAGLQRVMGRRAAFYGGSRHRADIDSLVAVQEALGSYREITVSDRRSLYVGRIQALRSRAAHAAAGLQVVTMLPKYVSEAALVVGAFSLAGVLFATKPVAVAAGTFGLFLAAATRVMPSLLRLQTATLTIRSSAGTAASTFALAEDLGEPLDAPQEDDVNATVRRVVDPDYSDFRPTINLSNVHVSYPGAAEPSLRGISLAVEQGQSVALVGRSGAGKSTLADVILGVLQPDAGEVTVGGLPPGDAVQRWPGGIGYVPQDVMLANDSLRANVALGLPREAVDDDQVWGALRRARLNDFVGEQADSLDMQIGERGLRISGGQRQRLGIARALFTGPRLLVLDEATSALDAETEQAITKTLEELEDDVTTVIIAHRLSTVRHADIVVYLEDGKALAQGTFDQVCREVPALARQADLMGLRPSLGQSAF
jgi:ABC-type multidrug transport system fused ATPase/permease subunit